MAWTRTGAMYLLLLDRTTSFSVDNANGISDTRKSIYHGLICSCIGIPIHFNDSPVLRLVHRQGALWWGKLTPTLEGAFQSSFPMLVQLNPILQPGAG